MILAIYKNCAKILLFFQICKFFFQIRPELCILKQKSRVRDWKVLQKFGIHMDYRRVNRSIWFVCHKPCYSHKRANALSKGSLLRVAGRKAQIWYYAIMRNLWTPAKPDRRSSGEDDLQNYGGNAPIKIVEQNTKVQVVPKTKLPVVLKIRPPVGMIACSSMAQKNRPSLW